jgi:hypothetical protein
MTVDEKVATALQTEFEQGQIYHDNVPENGTYPMICYTDLSETPALHADNKLYARSHVIRVTVVTLGNHDINTLKEKVERCMVDAGFMWQTTNKTRDGKEYYTSLDFEIGVEENG